jgi:hypothetical protein
MSKAKKAENSVKLPDAQPSESNVQSAPTRIQLDFDAWWMLVSQMRGLKPQVKTAIKKHFEARGFMANKNFDDGLKDYGL